jgi:membrane protein
MLQEEATGVRSMATSLPIQSADPHPEPGVVGAVKETAKEFSQDDVMTQAAALAFYSGLAMAPLLTIAVWVMQMFFGTEAKVKIAAAFGQVIGPQAAAPIKELLNPAAEHASQSMTLAGIFSLCLLLFSASGVFAQLQSALNIVWDVRAKPKSSWNGFINKRLLSMGMLFSILFMLMVSLVLSTMLQALLGTGEDDEKTILMTVLDHGLSLGMFTVLFAALFKYVPDAKLEWSMVWPGAFMSAVLFTIGKIGLSFYLGRGSYESSYGAAVGSFVALLVWVYYSAVIVLVGAEITEVWARRHGHAVEPSEHAVRVIHKEKEIK